MIPHLRRLMQTVTLPLAVVLLVFAPLVTAQDAKNPGAISVAEFTAFKDIKSALVSPDGKTIVCTVGTIDLQANRVKSEIWTMPVEAGEAKKLAFETDAIERVLWSPQGNQLAVVGTVRARLPGEKSATHLWVLDPATEKSRRLTQIERSNHYLAHAGANLCWSPDGAFLAYLAVDAAASPPSKDPIVITRQQYKTRTSFSDNRTTQIWTVEVATGKTRQLTKGPFDNHSIDWSPKGDEIAFCSNRAKDPDANLNYDLYTINVADGAVVQLTKTAGSEMTPVWSPDGQAIAFTMTKRPETTIDSVAEDDHIWLLDRKTGQARELTAKLDRRCSSVRWSGDGKALYFLARDHGKTLIYHMPAEGGDATPLFSMNAAVASFSLPRAAQRGACILSQPTLAPEVWTFTNTGEPHMRTRLNVQAIATGLGLDRDAKLGEPSMEAYRAISPIVLDFKSFDGTPVQGWLMLPRGASPAKKAPLILSIHGGPHGMHGYTFSANYQRLCTRGYAILLINPRGSAGYGQRFSDGCVNDWGGGDFKDLMAGVDFALAKHPELDATRMGVTGGSYGGYMTNWVITQTDRFQVAVTSASLSNLISFYATSLYQDLIHVEFGAEPWDRFEILWDRSPLKHIKKAKTPTLIVHGEQDFDVHITQAEELFTALKRRSVETVFVRYPREGHGLSEPKHQLDAFERTSAWFDRFLQPKR